METTKLRNYAFSILALSRKFLAEDGDLDPTAFIVTEGEQLVRPLDFSSEIEKAESCAEISAEASAHDAVAIVTSFLARASEFPAGDFDPAGYSWGQLQDRSYEESILITLSGPSVANWAVSLPFARVNGEIVFGNEVEYTEGLQLGLFPGWSH